ncbi:MAG TPA: Clp protease N-terminal domain-containing protein [Fimbriimonas sp.]|nr:Clp protease N-terminal domain-containing protein [Fimbriimonas sp.]
MDYAYHESQKLGDSFIGTEHLLLGLIREEEGLAIDLSYTEARLLGDGFIGTEHVLLGLIHEGDGLAGRLLASHRLTLDLVRSTVIEVRKRASG